MAERSIPEEVRAALGEYRRLLEERVGSRLQDLRLFGSVARGDAGPESDVDVAVIVRGLSEMERAEAIDLALVAWREAGGRGPMLAPLVWSDLELADRLARERRLALNLQEEGIPV